MDVALISFILMCCVAMRTMLSLSDEVREFRVDTVAQLVATRTAIQLESNDISANLAKIALTSKVLTDRLDNQLTSARGAIRDASHVSQQSVATESKKIQEAISDSVTPAADSLVKMADKVDSTPPGKPIVVAVPAPTVVTAPPIITPSVEEPKIMLIPAKEKKSKWKSFWHHANPRSW